MVIIITRWRMENPTIVGLRLFESQFAEFSTSGSDLWVKRSRGVFPIHLKYLTELTSAKNEVRRGKMPRAIIQSSMVETKLVPMMKAPADLKLEAFLCNYCCYGESDSNYRPTTLWLALENSAFYPLRLPLWKFFTSVFLLKISYFLIITFCTSNFVQIFWNS